MKDQRKRFSGDFKTKVAVEAIKGHRTATEIAGEYGVHPNQITQWKKQALEGLPELLSDKRKKREMDQEDLAAQLYQQIGRLKVELDWLKKKLDLPLLADIVNGLTQPPYFWTLFRLANRQLQPAAACPRGF